MASKNYGFELYQLIMKPDEDLKEVMFIFEYKRKRLEEKKK